MAQLMSLCLMTTELLWRLRLRRGGCAPAPAPACGGLVVSIAYLKTRPLGNDAI